MRAVVLLSGGQDSVTCLGVAMRDHGNDIHTIGFNYGQKHSIELFQARAIAARYNLPFTEIRIDALAMLADSALLESSDQDVSLPNIIDKNIPAAFVPARNALFLTLAHAYAQKYDCDVIYGGMCQTDHEGFSDCREKFIVAMNFALNTGYKTQIQILTPLMNLTKAETFALAEEVDILDVVINETHTCYNGIRDQLYPWGYGCGKCPACELRKKGYEEYVENMRS